MRRPDQVNGVELLRATDRRPSTGDGLPDCGACVCPRCGYKPGWAVLAFKRRFHKEPPRVLEQQWLARRVQSLAGVAGDGI
jgi:hypothetical protein